MKTKRLAAVLAVLLALACCAAAWGDVIDPSDRLYPWKWGMTSAPPAETETSWTDDAPRSEVKATVTIIRTKDREDGAPMAQVVIISDGPGEYDYAVYGGDGAEVILSDKGVFVAPGYLLIRKKFVCEDLSEGKTAYYRLEASFTPYRYARTHFGIKLYKDSDDKLMLDERQDLSRLIIVENVSGDVRIRVEEP